MPSTTLILAIFQYRAPLPHLKQSSILTVRILFQRWGNGRMFRRLMIFLLAGVAWAGMAAAQDGLNLPTELYVLTNAGIVQRYGLGISGVNTVTPEEAFVLDFGVAPDGNWIAYRTENSLDLLNMYTGESSTIDGAATSVPPFRGRGDTIAWSPTGDALAYTTMYGARVWFNTGQPTFVDLQQGPLEQVVWAPNGAFLAAEAEPNIWWLFRRDGSTLTLTSAIPSSLGLAWVGPTDVVFAPEEGGLNRMNLAQGNAQTVLLDNTWVYSQPYEMPDGTLAVFGRQKTEAQVPEGYGRLLGLAPDSPRVNNLSDTSIELRDLRWAPQGELMVAFRGGVLALVIPTNGQGLTLPISDAVAYSWGAKPLPSADQLRLPADGFFITPDENDTAQVWRLPADGSTPVQLTAAVDDVTAYSLSPDGTILIYASGGQLWQQPLTDSGAQVLDDLGGRTNEIHDLTFSPDSRLIAFSTLITPQALEGGVWVKAMEDQGAEMVAASGMLVEDEVVYAPPFYRQPQFSPQSDQLLVVQGGSETTTFTLHSTIGQDSVRTDLGDFDDALWLSDGRILAWGSGIGIGDPPPTQPIVVINPADGVQTPLASIPYPARIELAREITPGQVRLVLQNVLPGPHMLNVVDLQTDTGALSGVGIGGFMVHPVLSPDGTWLGGQTHDDGPLTFRNLQTGQQVILNQPQNVRAFQWASIR